MFHVKHSAGVISTRTVCTKRQLLGRYNSKDIGVRVVSGVKRSSAELYRDWIIDWISDRIDLRLSPEKCLSTIVTDAVTDVVNAKLQRR